MDEKKEKLAGKLENLKGRAKEAGGALTGDRRTEAEGLAERVKGAGREKIADAKRRFEDESDDE